VGRLTRWLLALVLLAGCAGSPQPLPPAPDGLASLRAQATAVRGLEFKEAVRLERIGAEDVRALLRREVEALYPPAQLRAYEDAYRTLGVLPPGVDLLEALLELQAHELAGLYLPRAKTMYVLREFAMGDQEGSLVLLHELVHALQDQHFPRVFALLEGVQHDDDLVTAIASVLEGDASLATLFGHASGGARDVGIAEQMREAMLREARASRSGQPEVPLLLRVSLAFPYAHGTVLAARAFASGGNAALDRAIDDPPLSTRDLVAGVREPVEFVVKPWDDLARDAGELGCALGHDNVAGILTLGVLFEVHGAPLPRTLFDEWRGDRFLHLRCEGAPELFWVVRWSTPAAAAEFARRFRAIAPSVARWAAHAAPAAAVAEGRDVRIATPLAARPASRWLARSEFRRHARLSDWLVDGCVGEPACPETAR
jgi:hypothetical protein